MKNLRFRLVDFYRNTNVEERYNFLMKSQWWEKDQILNYQLAKLKKLINHAYLNVPYYKNLFDRIGIAPQDIKELDDLKNIPVLDKTIIKNNYKDLIASNAKKYGLWQKSTGGSTGEPLKYFLSYNSLTYDTANRLRAWTQAGYKVGDKVIYFGGPSITGNIDFKRRIYFKLYNFIPVSSFDINNDMFDDLIEKIISSKAKIMFSYASSASLLANYLLKNKIRQVKFNGVFTTAEMLFPQDRKRISEAFHCEVFNLYGANDGGIMAFECNYHGGLHIAAERSIVELVDNDDNPIKSEDIGTLVATDLTNYSMPFIRYKVNDLLSFSSFRCSCGRHLPLIKEIKGRTSDFIIDKKGNKIHGEFFSHLFSQYNWIDQFQIIQENLNNLTVLLKGSNSNKNDLIEVKNFLQSKFPDILIDIKFVEEIEKTKNNKQRFVISEINT